MEGKVLLLSGRRIADLVGFCDVYEFEDTIASVTDATRIDAIDPPSLEFSRRVYRLARMVSGSRGLARRLAPYPRGKVVLEEDFELFFPVFSHSYQLYSLSMICNWRQRCAKAACFISEVRESTLPTYLIELLTDFDHVFLASRSSVDDVARMTGRPCTYLPLGVDVLRFTPASIDEPRPIDVCYIGRRSEVTHQALLKEAEEGQVFYYYDTVAASGADLKSRTFRVGDAGEHRRLLGALLKRSRYFIANRGYINMPEFTAGRDEIASRFYEGSAAGTVMLGEAPGTEEFRSQFDWPDVVLHLPFNSPDVGRILADLNADTARLRSARRNNARGAALRHDWLYRFQAVFDTLGMPHTEKMFARAERLKRIASAI